MEGLGDLTKYTTKKKTKGKPNSERSEQLTLSMEITKKPFVQLAGLTRHLQPDQIFRLNKESKGAPELWWYLLKFKYMNRQNNPDYKLVKEKLIKHPEYRERKGRDPFNVVLALRKIGLEATMSQTIFNLKAEEMADFAVKFGSYSRWWRAVTEDCPELRGSDWLSTEQENKQRERIQK